MARMNAAFDIKSFDKGFITDSSPVDFPDGASYDEANFWIRENGERHRRLGLKVNVSPKSTPLTEDKPLGLAGIWHNVGGFSDQHFLFIQNGSEVSFFRYNGTDLDDQVGSLTIGAESKYADAAVLDGDLIIVNGEKDIRVLTCENPTADTPVITTKTHRLEIRDTFGVPDVVYRKRGTLDEEKIDLNNPKWVSYRPIGGVDSNDKDTNTLAVHIYNLRNQTWGHKRLSWTDPAGSADEIRAQKKDPITMFEKESKIGEFPSNADSVIASLQANVEVTTNRTIERFNALDAYGITPPSMAAPKGYFIIDALDRATSRQEAYEELLKREGAFDEIPAFPTDQSTGGAKAITEYGGRLWYAGFEDATESSTRLGSFLLYSQISRDRNAIARCYQNGDPTDKKEPEILATDGGSISIDGAYNIKKLEVLGTTLLVFAENGVWAVSGGSGDYFSPTSQRIERISTKGCISANSVVVDNLMCMYWSEDGIYAIQYEQQGRLGVNSVTRLRIQKYINNISPKRKSEVYGAYDGSLGQAVWVIPGETRYDDTEVLRFHVQRVAFTKDVFRTNSEYRLDGFIKVPPFSYAKKIPTDPEGNPLPSIEEGVYSQFSTVAIGVKDNIASRSITRSFFVGSFSQEEFLDWETDDARAFILTGAITGNDLARRKQVPYLTTHFRKTETYMDPVTQEPAPQSGCMMGAQWDWATSAVSGKWSEPQQVYRLRRAYFPSGLGFGIQGGVSTVVTRNKVRGRGRSIAFKFTTEPKKDCQLLGWNFQMDANNKI